MEAPHTKLRLRVVPGASHPGVVGRHGDAWKVRVAAAPEDGKANEAVLALLAHALDVPRRDLELTAGATSRDKIVTITGVTETDAELQLAAVARNSA